MPDLRALAGAVAVTVPFAVGLGVGAAADGSGEVAFRFADSAIVESSGLAVVDGLVVTTNDSGDVGVVHVVDPATGETVGSTTWSAAPVDVEALAPADGGAVWVGDIGDNLRRRESVEVARVQVGPRHADADVTTYELSRAPADAETLLAHPATGRLYVVTKGVFGGQVLAAPARLRAERVHRLRPVADVAGMVTDGAFTPDGGHVVLRTYTRGLLYAFPSWDLVASWDLPEQPQGEGLAVHRGSLLLSTEGLRTPVLRVPLPPELAARLAVALMGRAASPFALPVAAPYAAPSPGRA